VWRSIDTVNVMVRFLPALALYQGIHFLGHELQDFSDTAALMEELDLIISIDTSVLHLAGALGRPTLGAAAVRRRLALADAPSGFTLVSHDAPVPSAGIR
jgi:hypothetical protein